MLGGTISRFARDYGVLVMDFAVTFPRRLMVRLVLARMICVRNLRKRERVCS